MSIHLSTLVLILHHTLYLSREEYERREFSDVLEGTLIRRTGSLYAVSRGER